MRTSSLPPPAGAELAGSGSAAAWEAAPPPCCNMLSVWRDAARKCSLPQREPGSGRSTKEQSTCGGWTFGEATSCPGVMFDRPFALRRSRDPGRQATHTFPYSHVYCYMLAIRALSGGTVPRRPRAGAAELRVRGASLPSFPRARRLAGARAAAKGGAEPEYVFGACAAGALSVRLTLCGGDNERGRKMAVPTNPVDKFWYNFYFAKPQQSDWERQLQEFADSKARVPVGAGQSRSC